MLRIAALAAEYRFTFHSDVVIDLVGYRRHGHSEVDDPTITQPLRYAKIKEHPVLYQIYAKQIGADISARTKELQAELVEAQKEATVRKKMPISRICPNTGRPTRAAFTSPSTTSKPASPWKRSRRSAKA